MIVLARPRGAALVTALPAFGFGYALWQRGSTVSPLEILPELSLLLASWLALHAGAMWLNAAMDRDQGPVLLGRPARVPEGASRAGYVALSVSVALAALLGSTVLAASAACAVLAVLYSHPRVALKGRPVGGPLVNALGYGALSPIAGFAAASGVPTWRAAITLSAIVIGILGVYFAAQVFQGAEDRARGYRTLVVTHGPAWTLAVAHACLRTGVLVLLALSVAGAYPRAFLIGAPLWLWADRHLVAWRARPASDRGGPLVSRLSLAVLATILAAYGHHAWELAHDRPGGGCGTVIHPSEPCPASR